MRTILARDDPRNSNVRLEDPAAAIFGPADPACDGLHPSQETKCGLLPLRRQKPHNAPKAGKKPRVALVAVMRKLLHAIYGRAEARRRLRGREVLSDAAKGRRYGLTFESNGLLFTCGPSGGTAGSQYNPSQSMYVELSRAVTEVARFMKRHQIEAEFHIHTVGQLQGTSGIPDPYWARFEKRPGVYVLFNCQGGAVHYVGMSQRDTGSRLYGWVFQPNKVNEALAQDDLVLSVVMEDQSYMSPALESCLIRELRPTLNVRGAV